MVARCGAAGGRLTGAPAPCGADPDSAYLAALAMASGYRLVTTDAAFRQFDGLDLLLLA